MTHAFFKALLFLGAGSVIHALSGEQDMRQMGALKSKIPKTYWTMFVATLAIAGIPPLAGFVSKDLILGETWAWPPDAYKLLWIIGLATAGMTAFYMFRLLYLTFFGDSRVPHDVEHHIHESPNVMTTPLIILAVLSVVGGWIGWPKALLGGDWFTTWLRPVFARAGTEIAVAGAPAQAAEAATAEHTQRLLEYGLMAASVIIALIGISIAYRWYVRNRDIPRRLAERLALPYRLLLNKYYVDEGYDKVFVSGLAKGGGTVLWRFDATVIDGGVNGAGWLTRIVSRISMWLDKWIIDGVGVNGVAYTTRALSWPARLLQTGLVQSYALLIVFGLGAFVLYYLVR
jgi:NADH-quinone oxidoreductase subunit L